MHGQILGEGQERVTCGCCISLVGFRTNPAGFILDSPQHNEIELIACYNRVEYDGGLPDGGRHEHRVRR